MMRVTHGGEREQQPLFKLGIGSVGGRSEPGSSRRGLPEVFLGPYVQVLHISTLRGEFSVGGTD